MKKALTVGFIIAGVLISGCSNVIPTYSSSMNNVRSLKAGGTSTVNVGKFIADQEEKGTMCRVSLSITTPNDMTFSQYIGDAFANEIEMANRLDPKSNISISGKLNKMYGSSTIGNAYWEFDTTLSSSNGKQLNTVYRYDYPSAFDGFTACGNMKSTFPAAVQGLINKIVTDPKFPELVK